MVTHALEGFKLSVDRGPNWLFIRLRPKRHFAEDIAQIADELWSIASRHFIYRLVLELDELHQMPVSLVDQLVILQDRLVQSDGSLRICGLSADCAQMLCDRELDAALPNYPTRQEAVLGGDATTLHERLKEMLASAASDDEMQAAAAFAKHQSSLH